MKLSALSITLLSSISLVASLQPSEVESGTGIHPGDPEPPAPATEKEVIEELGGKVPELDKIKVDSKKIKPKASSSWWGIGSWFGEPESVDTAPASDYVSNIDDAYGVDDTSSSWFSWVPSLGLGSPSSAPDTGTDLIELSEDSSWGDSILSSFTSGMSELGSYGASGLGYLGDAGLVGLEYLGSAGLTGLEYAGAGISDAAAFATHPDTLAAMGNAIYTGGHALAVTTGVTAGFAGNLALSMLNAYIASQSEGNSQYDNHGDNYDDSHDYDDNDDNYHRHRDDKDRHRNRDRHRGRDNRRYY